jgi:hypothetical protein
MSNLIATEQVRGGDSIRVDFELSRNCLTFLKDAEGISMEAMADLTVRSTALPLPALSSGVAAKTAKTAKAASAAKAASTAKAAKTRSAGSLARVVDAPVSAD